MTYNPERNAYLSWRYAIDLLRWRLRIVRLLRARAGL